MIDIHAVIERHTADLLALPGCTAVAIGKKIVAGEVTDRDCIVVYVQKKAATAMPHAVPAQLDGIPTDVIERTFDFRESATNPFERFDPLISGVSVTAYEDSLNYGSIGCFIAADGTIPGVPAANYMLTNQHVLQAAAQPNSDHRVIQPGNVNFPPPDNDVMGHYQAGERNETHDCAVSTIQGRTFQNVVPNHPWQPGRRMLRGIAVAAVGDYVYKYGATTLHTTGSVANIHFSTPGIRNAIYIQAENDGLWCAGGDSGSVVVRYADDLVLGLNFRADTNAPVRGGFSAGLAYDITNQIRTFSTNVRLA